MKLSCQYARRLSASLICALALACQAAPKTYDTPEYVRWEAKKGNWNDPKSWAGGKVPSGFAIAGCRMAATVTLDSPVPQVFAAGFGGPGAGVSLYIKEGAKLRLDSSLSIFSHENNSRCAAEMTGGEIEVGLNGEYATLGIAASSTFSTHAVMTVSGGIIKGAISVGSATGAGGAGLLVIKGSAAQIEDNGKRAALGVFGTGTIQFILDEKGVSVLNYAKRTVAFGPGAKLQVDASQYRGNAKRIPLVLAARWQDVENLELSVTTQPRTGLAELKVEKPPAKQLGIFLDFKKK